MKFSIKIHGDSLERTYSDFILRNFNTYESVWSIYIGNKGNNTKADLDGYPYEEKRQSFSEHTYTILQSVISLYRLIDNPIFQDVSINDIEQVLDLQNNLLLFFTHIGRINDNIVSASSCLTNSNTKDVADSLSELYHKRHILVHGKLIPIAFETNGKISLPILSKGGVDITGWNHKQHNWQDMTAMKTESVAITLSQLYWELLPKLVDIFAKFKSDITKELTLLGLSLKFEHYILHASTIPPPSGSISSVAVDVYGIGQYHPNKP